MEFRERPKSRERKVELKNEGETISTAAIEYRGETFTGVNHAKAIDELKKVHPDITWGRDIRAGFLTTKGRFVEMNEAVNILRRNKRMVRGSKSTLDK
ncbi:MAG: hypothetical protein Q7S05_04005 [bacterium]|nr:hypothetical protein [bacterium]